MDEILCRKNLKICLWLGGIVWSSIYKIKYEKLERNNVCMLIRNCDVGIVGLQRDLSINFAFKIDLENIYYYCYKFTCLSHYSRRERILADPWFHTWPGKNVNSFEKGKMALLIVIMIYIHVRFAHASIPSKNADGAINWKTCG